jgi:hypothetical protein
MAKYSIKIVDHTNSSDGFKARIQHELQGLFDEVFDKTSDSAVVSWGAGTASDNAVIHFVDDVASSYVDAKWKGATIRADAGSHTRIHGKISGSEFYKHDVIGGKRTMMLRQSLSLGAAIGSDRALVSERDLAAAESNALQLDTLDAHIDAARISEAERQRSLVRGRCCKSGHHGEDCETTGHVVPPQNRRPSINHSKVVIMSAHTLQFDKHSILRGLPEMREAVLSRLEIKRKSASFDTVFAACLPLFDRLSHRNGRSSRCGIGAHAQL